MTLEQITFRISISGPHESTFVHFVDSGAGCFTVKVGEILMSTDEFRNYLHQLKKIDSRLAMIEEFARNVES